MNFADEEREMELEKEEEIKELEEEEEEEEEYVELYEEVMEFEDEDMIGDFFLGNIDPVKEEPSIE